MAPTLTPTPIPVLAPVLRPEPEFELVLFDVSVDVSVDNGVEVAGSELAMEVDVGVGRSMFHPTIALAPTVDFLFRVVVLAA